MQKPRLILLSGWKGSGKDTVAKLLCEAFGYKRLAFADALKDLVADTYRIPREDLDHVENKNKPIPAYPFNVADSGSEAVSKVFWNEGAKLGGVVYHTPRSLCILEGTVKRSVNPNYWVDAIRDVIEKNPDTLFVISDWRYRSEYVRLRGFSPLTVRVSRFTESPSTDASERDLDFFPFNVVLENKGTIEELRNRLREIFEFPKGFFF